MKAPKSSINIKVLIGYFILLVIAAGSIWFVYTRVMEASEKNRERSSSNEKLFLMTEAMTTIYTAENLSREIIQNQDGEAIEQFDRQIDSTKVLLDSLKMSSSKAKFKSQLDSISALLTRKQTNLKEFVKLRKRNRSRNYYDRVLKRLQEFNYYFEEENFEKAVEGLDSVQQQAILKWLRYAKKDNAKRLTQQSVDSLVYSMKTVLMRMENEEMRYQQTVIAKEDELLKTDRELSRRLRELRADIEREEIQRSIDQVSKSRRMLADTTDKITWLSIGFVVTILVFIVIILRDTRRSQKNRQELEKAKKYAESLLKRQEQFMAAITHDLRSPLNTIVGYSDLLGDSGLSKAQTNYLEQMQKSSAYILRLVNDLLDYSKLESKKMSIEELPFNPQNLIDDCLASSIPLNPKKDIEIKKIVDQEVDGFYLSDPFRIQQVLNNLLSNAYKFTDHGYIEIRSEIETKGQKQKFLIVEIKDSGIGIEANKQKEIFKEFSQADPSIEKKYGGSGLGLAITRKLVKLLGGKITLESEYGKGTQFRVYIPVKDTTAKASSRTPKRRSQVGSDKKVLVVDDDAAQLNLSTKILEQSGFQVERAKDGLEAFNYLGGDHYDLIITDIQMPKCDGFELLKNIKSDQNTAKIPVIALSGRSDISAETYSNKGFSASLTKPFPPRKLINTVAQTLNLNTTQVAPAHEPNKQKPKGSLYDLTLLKQFTGDDQSLTTVLNSFMENTRELMPKLKAAVEAQETEEVAFYAHKLLPMIKQLRAKNIETPLEQLERPHQNQLSLEEVTENFKLVEHRMERLLNTMEKEVNPL